MCTIIVGKEKMPFFSSLQAIGASEELSDLVQFTDELGSHVTLEPERFAISAKSFMPIFEYLRNRDFHPVLISHRGQTMLQGVLLREDADKAAKVVAETYRGASLLHMAPLQSLCLQKMGLLFPLGSKGIVAAAGAWLNSEKWGFEQEGELERLVKSYFKEHFWMLMECEGKAVSRMLRARPELKGELLKMVLEDDEAGMRGFDL